MLDRAGTPLRNFTLSIFYVFGKFGLTAVFDPELSTTPADPNPFGRGTISAELNPITLYVTVFPELPVNKLTPNPRLLEKTLQ